VEIIFLPEAQKDLKYWRQTGNTSIQNKITQLLQAIQKDPFHGIGKPEMLKHELAGKWSRRISHEHRLIYQVSVTRIFVYSLRGHYLD
jgi:toxin YoeB